jgi:hypothetical protein
VVVTRECSPSVVLNVILVFESSPQTDARVTTFSQRRDFTLGVCIPLSLTQELHHFSSQLFHIVNLCVAMPLGLGFHMAASAITEMNGITWFNLFDAERSEGSPRRSDSRMVVDAASYCWST